MLKRVFFGFEITVVKSFIDVPQFNIDRSRYEQNHIFGLIENNCGLAEPFLLIVLSDLFQNIERSSNERTLFGLCNVFEDTGCDLVDLCGVSKYP